jgi:hypothetical protein
MPPSSISCQAIRPVWDGNTKSTVARPASARSLSRRGGTQPLGTVEGIQCSLCLRLVGGFNAHRGKQAALCFYTGANDHAERIAELGLNPHARRELVKGGPAVFLTCAVWHAVFDPIHRH